VHGNPCAPPPKSGNPYPTFCPAESLHASSVHVNSRRLGQLLYPLSGEGVICAPPQVIGPYSRPYRGYSTLRTQTALGSYGRAIPRSIGSS